MSAPKASRVADQERGIEGGASLKSLGHYFRLHRQRDVDLDDALPKREQSGFDNFDADGALHQPGVDGELTLVTGTRAVLGSHQAGLVIDHARMTAKDQQVESTDDRTVRRGHLVLEEKVRRIPCFDVTEQLGQPPLEAQPRSARARTGTWICAPLRKFIACLFPRVR